MRLAIEVIVGSGLGNQMFQYAFGRTLSILSRRPLILDISLLALDPPWQFDLRHLRLGTQRIRDWPFWGWNSRSILMRVLAAYGLDIKRRVEEPSLRFAPEVLELRKPCILNGYWQSERYFESISGQLREDFSIVAGQDPRSAECQKRIRGVKSIGLHVRRGDYVSIRECNAFHGTCSKDYYEAALRLVLARVGSDAELFVFSDDMDWSRETIRFPLPTTYIDWNKERSYEDLRLMSSCQALIMANSTFSWWGGWLNPRPDKLVIAPRQWYQAPGVVSDLPDSPWLITI